MRVWAALPFDSFACSFGYKLVATRLTRLRRNLPITHFVNLLVAATDIKTLLNNSTFVVLFVILNREDVLTFNLLNKWRGAYAFCAVKPR